MKLFKKIMLMFLCLIPMSISAKRVDVDYKVTDVFINATVDVIGSIHVQEAIIVKGSLNGYERDIAHKNPKFDEWEPGKVNFEGSAFYNGRGVSFSKAYSFTINKDQIGFEVFPSVFEEAYKEAESAVPGDTDVYTVEEYDGGKKIRIYNPNESGYVVYVFDYYVNQTVVLHNDVAEMYWTFLPKDFDDVDNVKVQVTLPGNSSNEKFRFWAHGPSQGTVRGISTALDEKGNVLYGGVYADVQNVDSGKGLDIRMTFDKDLVKVAELLLNHSTQDALDEIIEVENDRANYSNKVRLREKVFYYTLWAINLIYIVGLGVFWVYLYFYHDKEYKSRFKGKYYREFIEDYSVETVEYIMTKKISPKAFTASLLNLIYKKKISLKESENKKDKYILTLNNSNGLSEAETKLVNLIFNQIGNGNEVTIKEIEKYSSSTNTNSEFLSAYNSWKDSLISSAEKENFFEKNTKYKVAAMVYVVLGLVIMLVCLFMKVIEIYFIVPLCVVFFAFTIYVLIFKKWTNRGREDSAKWRAFKNFLTDFGTFDKKELPEIKLWEKYMVYATVLGVADKVEEAMKINLTDLSDKEINALPSYLFNTNLNFSNNFSKSISNSIISSQNVSTSMSSGSGYGGGFSSGGGFAGGGGGGRGF